MSSVFSFLESDAGEESAPEGAAPLAADPVAASASMSHTSVDFDQVIADLLAALEGYLPDPVSGQPDPGVSLLQVNEKPLALGNLRGMERRSLLSPVVLKGGRLEALVNFRVWGSDESGANTAMSGLQARLLHARDELWNAGILRLKADSSGPAEEDTTAGAWKRGADYRLLYEYHYEDTDEAQSLIARIPVHTDPEERDSLQRETFTVTDEMVRWDQESAPALVLHGPMQVGGLSALAFAAGSLPVGTVRLLRSFTGAGDPPTDYPDAATFLEALSDPEAPERNGQLNFPAYGDFLDAFSTDGAPLPLGDWDEDTVTDNYLPHRWDFPRPILLETSSDWFLVIYRPEEDAPKFDQVAVAYIRANPA